MVPLKALVAKAVLLLLMGPLTLTGGLLGWLFGRALWRRRSAEREATLARVFRELLAAAAPKPAALGEPPADPERED
ncbi:MAG: hypothetical protein R3B09_20145 [Nannocystaceae bacterium]